MAPRQGALDHSALLALLLAFGSSFTTMAGVNVTLAPGAITGSLDVYLTSTGNGANALTTRTAAQMFADLCAAFGLNDVTGLSYSLTITNTGNNTVTLTAGTNVTLTGTMTIATNTTRTFVVTVNGPNAITIQSVGVGSIS
ncbi:MAG TPA: hypothetical protein VET48_07975 [Steroidobacteraceae bacterium]|nr:hypothetical protein [Steroidobacteraceae bacterium]